MSKKKKYHYPKNGNMRIELDRKTHRKMFDMAQDQNNDTKPFIELTLSEIANSKTV